MGLQPVNINSWCSLKGLVSPPEPTTTSGTSLPGNPMSQQTLTDMAEFVFIHTC